MTIGLADTLRTTLTTAIGTGSGGLGSGAKLKVYGGTRPAKGATAATSPLVTFTWGGAFFASVTNGVGTANSVSSQAATGGGASPGTNATWARLTTSADVFVADLDVTATGGGGEVTLNSVAIISSPAATIAITSLTITAPGA